MADGPLFICPRCECGRFMKILGARRHGEGYAAGWHAVGLCSRCGERPIEWEWLGDFDPEESVSG